MTSRNPEAIDNHDRIVKPISPLDAAPRRAANREMSMQTCFIAAMMTAGSAVAQPIVLPGAYANTSGQVPPSDTLTREFARTHQQVIAASQLVTVPVGARITQFTLRASNYPLANTLGPWPPVPVTFVDFEVYIARGAVPAGEMSTIFAENIVSSTEVRVRDGALVIPAGSFNNFVAPPAANPWGLDIQISPFTYQGGDLVITVRHSGHQTPQVPRLYLDTISNPVPALTQCMAAAGIGATIGSPQMSLPVIARIRYVPPTSCYSNCDGSTVSPMLSPNDYQCFINRYWTDAFAGQSQQISSYANCDGSTGFPVLNIGDFICFNSRFAAGCT
jgi:hypothetical protein